jgi:hypothetical protein
MTTRIHVAEQNTAAPISRKTTYTPGRSRAEKSRTVLTLKENTVK